MRHNFCEPSNFLSSMCSNICYYKICKPLHVSHHILCGQIILGTSHLAIAIPIFRLYISMGCKHVANICMESDHEVGSFTVEKRSRSVIRGYHIYKEV